MLKEQIRKYTGLGSEQKEENIDLKFENFTAVISNERRREIIKAFDSQNIEESVNSEILSRLVSAEIYDKKPGEVTDSEYKRIYVSLYQTHLPKLDDLGVIEFNKDINVVKKTEKTDSVLKAIKELERRFK